MIDSSKQTRRTRKKNSLVPVRSRKKAGAKKDKESKNKIGKAVKKAVVKSTIKKVRRKTLTTKKVTQKRKRTMLKNAKKE